jgi:nitrogen regulatory protein P-II 1
VEFDRGTSTMMEEYNTNVTIMTIVTDSMVDRVIKRILNNMEDNEGKIFVYDVKETIDIKSKGCRESAL